MNVRTKHNQSLKELILELDRLNQSPSLLNTISKIRSVAYDLQVAVEPLMGVNICEEPASRVSEAAQGVLRRAREKACLESSSEGWVAARLEGLDGTEPWVRRFLLPADADVIERFTEEWAEKNCMMDHSVRLLKPSILFDEKDGVRNLTEKLSALDASFQMLATAGKNPRLFRLQLVVDKVHLIPASIRQAYHLKTQDGQCALEVDAAAKLLGPTATQALESETRRLVREFNQQSQFNAEEPLDGGLTPVEVYVSKTGELACQKIVEPAPEPVICPQKSASAPSM